MRKIVFSAACIGLLVVGAGCTLEARDGETTRSSSAALNVSTTLTSQVSGVASNVVTFDMVPASITAPLYFSELTVYNNASVSGESGHLRPGTALNPSHGTIFLDNAHWASNNLGALHVGDTVSFTIVYDNVTKVIDPNVGFTVVH